MPRATRRTFLKATTATAALTHLPTLASEPPPTPWPENGTLIPDTGWLLLLDTQAKWQDDTLHLPGEFNLTDLPTNPITGGWPYLNPQNGLPVTLPSTVEEHFWGRDIPGIQSRPYTPDEYRYAATDPIPQNGAYYGVSWWFRPIDIPADWAGKRIFLHIRAARLRAEVYLNRKLVGYSILEELPFECDLTQAAQPGGENQLAIRITNPFGRFDWVDGLNAQWGAVALHRSHGFGGLDRGITLSAHDDDRIADAWVLNTAKPDQIVACCEIESGFVYYGSGIVSLQYEMIDQATRQTIKSGDVDFQEALLEPANLLVHKFSFSIDVPNISLWTLTSPTLYDLRLTWRDYDHYDTRTIPFAFRTFAPANIGSPTASATFRLNGRRIKLYSSISWGFWGFNGLFPTPELAEKEVTQAKKLNLNTLNFHRNLAKEDVLRAGDRLGLLRVLEPGGGKLAIGKLPAGAASNAANIVMEPPTTEADKFAQRYMHAKCVAMVRAFRGHPSVVQYTLQNEIGADLTNPATLAILAAMRAEDPSRSIVLNDGFVAPPRRAAQAWYEPWNPTLHRSDQTEYANYWQQHQGAGDQWYDKFYKSSTDYTYNAPHLPGTLTEYGEMEGCAAPDNHALMLHSIGANGSYDKKDHAEIDAATSAFLTRWGFRQAFPTTEQLYIALGKRSFDSWANYLENARISDELDFAVISGWESTAIENHSGIVDNLRNFKSDPTPIAQALQPIHPCAKQRSLCIAQGQPAIFDLYLFNDTGRPATGTLHFTAITPSNKRLTLTTLPTPTQTPEVFSYLLHEAFQTPPLLEEGLYRFKFTLSSHPEATHTKDLWVSDGRLPLVMHITSGKPGKPGFSDLAGGLEVAVTGISSSLRKQLLQLRDIRVIDFDPTIEARRDYDLIISSGLTTATTPTQQTGETTGLESQPSAAPIKEPLGHIDPAVLAAGIPLLVIPQTDALSEGCASQLAAAGAFTYSGTVGDFRAPWMGNWYFVRRHPLYAGLPTDQAMGIHYQIPGRASNGLIIDGPNVEIVAAYSRDHDRHLGAGTFTTRLGRAKVLYHRIPDFHPVLQQRFLGNAISWLTS